jgi:hypothetical protein
MCLVRALCASALHTRALAYQEHLWRRWIGRGQSWVRSHLCRWEALLLARLQAVIQGDHHNASPVGCRLSGQICSGGCKRGITCSSIMRTGTICSSTFHGSNGVLCLHHVILPVRLFLHYFFDHCLVSCMDMPTSYRIGVLGSILKIWSNFVPLIGQPRPSTWRIVSPSWAAFFLDNFAGLARAPLLLAHAPLLSRAPHTCVQRSSHLG